jgi:hypothetical protein
VKKNGYLNDVTTVPISLASSPDTMPMSVYEIILKQLRTANTEHNEQQNQCVVNDTFDLSNELKIRSSKEQLYADFRNWYNNEARNISE